MTDPMERFRQVFFDESAEALQAIEQHLLALSLPAVDAEVVNDIFRSAHSLKGGSATFGMSALADFTHLMETLLDQVRAGSKPFTQEIVDCLFECLDALRNLVSHYQQGEHINDALINAVKQQLGRLIAGEVATPNTSIESQDDTSKAWDIDFAPHPDLLLSGNEPLRYLEELASLGTTAVFCDAAHVPELDQLSPLHLWLKWQVRLSAENALSKEVLTELFMWIEDDADLSFTPVREATPEETTPSSPPDASIAIPTAPTQPPAAAAKANPKAKNSQSIRVELRKIDALINLLGELVITQSMLSNFNDIEKYPELQSLQEGLSQLERHTRDLQDGVMQIRMLPIDFCFSRFPRMVRDLARQLGKDIHVHIVGETTEVDKTVIEELTDPLVHLVRNSVDHGIEMPQDRLSKGKPAQGTVVLRAFHQVGNIIIEIEDDGKGLDVDRLKKKALEKGLIKPSDKLSDQQIKELIFAPGFSTAEAVTDLSGRGVGMDVVKRNIQALGGQIDLRSTLHEGTKFIIRLPLTLAILEGQLVKVADETYVIPMLAIVESIQIEDAAINRVARHNTSFRWRSRFIPLLDLANTFGTEREQAPQQEKRLVVVVEHDAEPFGIIVDELCNHQQVVVKSLESNYKKVDELSGATILGDGSVALIIDVGALKQRVKVH